MSKRQQLERIFEIDRQIRAGLYPTAETIAAKQECSRRVIFQDKRFMTDRMGAPIEFDRQHGGWYYTDETWIMPSIMVTEGELLAFLLSIEVMQRHLGSDYEGQLRSAIDKIAANVKGPVTVDMEELRHLSSGAAPAGVPTDEQVLLDMYRATQEQRPVRMNYYSNNRGEWNTRTVNPHHLYFENQNWYMFAFDHLRGEMRNFHLGRIDGYELLSERFTRRPGFSAETWMGQAFQGVRGDHPQPVEIQFDEYEARWVRERKWPADYEQEALADGGLILRFETGGLDAVRRWVMQFGPHARILKPVSLQHEIAEAHRQAWAQYEPAEGLNQDDSEKI